MRFAASFPKENVTFENGASSALKVEVLAVVPSINLPLRNENGEAVATFEATEDLIRGAISTFKGGIFNVDHKSIPETMIGVFDAAIYDDGFKVSGSVLCPIWKEKIQSGDYSGISIEGVISGEMTNPDSIEIYAISFLSIEENSQGGACPLKDEDGNSVCNVEIVQTEAIAASSPEVVDEDNIDNSDKGEQVMKKKKEEEVEVKVEASGEEEVHSPEVQTEANTEIKASVPEVVPEVVSEETPLPNPEIEVAPPQPVAKTIDWELVSQEIGIKSKEEFSKIKETADKVSSLEEKIDAILKENSDLRSYKDDQTKKMLQEIYPPAITQDIAAAFAEYVKDPIAFTQKYAEDAVKFAAAKSVELKGSAVESEETEEVRKMAARKAKRDGFLAATGGPVV